jgi:hypothetical protein
MPGITQAEIDAMREEFARGLSDGDTDAGGGGMRSPEQVMADTAANEKPAAAVRPSALMMKPLVFDDADKEGSSPAASSTPGSTPASTPASAASPTQPLDEPCTYEVEGIGGRIPKGVSVDLNQMGMAEWDREREPTGDSPSAAPSEPVDTWNLVLDNSPSEMMAALDECPDGVDAVNEMGYTCVMWAALYGKEEHLIVLLECEADVSLTLKEDGNYSKTYPAGSNALDIARLTQEKTGSDRELIMQMLQAAMEEGWESWKTTEVGERVWEKWRSKWERDKQKRERKDAERIAKERKRRAAEQAAIDRLRSSPYAASVSTVKLWLSSLGHNIGQYSAVFDTHAVDGATLMRLSERHLKDELKVRTLGQRLRILRARDALETRETPLRPPFASKEEVGRWLAHIGLQIYSYAFESNDIDGESLCKLTEGKSRPESSSMAWAASGAGPAGRNGGWGGRAHAR